MLTDKSIGALVRCSGKKAPPTAGGAPKGDYRLCEYGDLPGRWIESGWGHDDNRRWQLLDEDCQLKNLLLDHLNSEWEAGPVDSEQHRKFKPVSTASVARVKKRSGAVSI